MTLTINETVTNPHSTSPGRKVMETSYGKEVAAQTLEYLGGVFPAYADYLENSCFGEVYTRPELSLARREYLNVVAIATLGGLDAQLRHHIAAALAAGVARQELLETFLHLSLIIGHPRASTGIQMVAEVEASQVEAS